MRDYRFAAARPIKTISLSLAVAACVLVFGASVASSQTTTTPQTTTRASGTSCESIPVDSVSDAASLTRALEGRIPGLSVLSSSGHLGSGSGFRIRGNASVTGSNEPLIVIDDIPIRPIPTASITRYADATRSLNPLDLVDPSDVVRVEVLRGPAATTMYGMEASNGVIRIYTKRGERKGGPRTGTRVRCPS